jgi:hypothetical protein
VASASALLANLTAGQVMQPTQDAVCMFLSVGHVFCWCLDMQPQQQQQQQQQQLSFLACWDILQLLASISRLHLARFCWKASVLPAYTGNAAQV